MVELLYIAIGVHIFNAQVLITRTFGHLCLPILDKFTLCAWCLAKHFIWLYSLVFGKYGYSIARLHCLLRYKRFNCLVIEDLVAFSGFTL